MVDFGGSGGRDARVDSRPRHGLVASRSRLIAEPKFLLPVVVLPEPLLGEDVMDKLMNELLLLTCTGTFVASATYAVTLLH